MHACMHKKDHDIVCTMTLYNKDGKSAWSRLLSLYVVYYTLYTSDGSS